MGLPPHRHAYVAAVRALLGEAERLLADGLSEEAVARIVVAKRNELKRETRKFDSPELVALLAKRNIDRYGDPLGASADWYFAHYGSWRLVIEAAARPRVAE